MRAVTIGRIARIFAAAKQRQLGALGREGQGFDPRAGMRPVAERLLLAAPATAPAIAPAGLELDLIGVKLRSLGLCHLAVLCESRTSRPRPVLLNQFAPPAQENPGLPKTQAALLIHWESVWRQDG